ncbi:transcriptional regulator, XRE family [mine drainage metagenome]|uniref:Transcriptional regulator, XRE family n=2 Tax=mine drainage metagenome TaxID=410659 RepID=T0YYV8_9ZZZZ
MSSIATPNDNAALGRRLMAVRATTGLSQGGFATSLGLSSRAYANYERGEREMPVALFRALYETYGIDPVWLLEGPGDHPVKAATRTMDFPLVDSIIRWLDAELARTHKKLRPRARLRVLKAAYALSAEKGRMDAAGLTELLAVAVGR